MEAYSPDGVATMQAKVAAVVAERKRLLEEVARLPGVERVWPSSAGFFIMRVPDAFNVYKDMAEVSHVVTRFRGAELNLGNVIRVSVGTRADNDAFLHALALALARRVPQAP